MFRTFRRRRMPVGLTLAAVLGAGGFATAISAATASDHRVGREVHRGAHDWGPGHDTYTIGLFGDMPYGALGRSQYPNLLADINKSDLAFSIFDGDLQAGGDGPCNDSLYTTAQAPYHEPIERLGYERQLFDSTSQSLGQQTLTR